MSPSSGDAVEDTVVVAEVDKVGEVRRADANASTGLLCCPSGMSVEDDETLLNSGGEGSPACPVGLFGDLRIHIVNILIHVLFLERKRKRKETAGWSAKI